MAPKKKKGKNPKHTTPLQPKTETSASQKTCRKCGNLKHIAKLSGYLSSSSLIFEYLMIFM